MSANNKGAKILLLYTLVTYIYSLVMLYVFYYLPLKSGLALPIVSVINLDDKDQSVQLIEEAAHRELVTAMATDEKFT